MSNKIKKVLIEIIKFSIIIFIVSNAISYYRSLDLNKNNIDENNFKLIDGSIYKLESDKPLLIYYWATWCTVCKVQSPVINELSKEYEVLTIAVQSGSQEKVKDFLKEKNYSFKVLNDENAYFSSKYKITVFPTIFIYNRNKELKFTEVGYTTSAGLKSRLALVD